MNYHNTLPRGEPRKVDSESQRSTSTRLQPSESQRLTSPTRLQPGHEGRHHRKHQQHAAPLLPTASDRGGRAPADSQARVLARLDNSIMEEHARLVADFAAHDSGETGRSSPAMTRGRLQHSSSQDGGRSSTSPTRSHDHHWHHRHHKPKQPHGARVSGSAAHGVSIRHQAAEQHDMVFEGILSCDRSEDTAG
jgi:hypothetical protein